MTHSRIHRCDVLAVSSTGGHWVELALLLPALEGLDVRYATSNGSAKRGVVAEHMHELPDANLRTPLRALACLWRVLQVIRATRPKIVLSTGAAPGLFAVAVGALFGAKTVWVEIVGVTRLTLSGRLARRFVDRFVVQWPEMVQRPDDIYLGSVL